MCNVVFLESRKLKIGSLEKVSCRSKSVAFTVGERLSYWYPIILGTSEQYTKVIITLTLVSYNEASFRERQGNLLLLFVLLCLGMARSCRVVWDPGQMRRVALS